MSVSDEPMPYDSIVAGEFYRLIRDGDFRKICPSLHEFVNKFWLVSYGTAGVNILEIVGGQAGQHNAIWVNHSYPESFERLSKLSFVLRLCVVFVDNESDQ